MEMTHMNPIPLRTMRRLSVIFFILGLLFLTIGICIGTMTGLIVLAVGLVILVGTCIFIALFARCPHCGGFIKLGFRNYYCPNCGQYVDYNND